MKRCAQKGCPGEGRFVSSIGPKGERYAVVCSVCGLRSPWQAKPHRAGRWWDRQWHEAHRDPVRRSPGTVADDVWRRMDALGVPSFGPIDLVGRVQALLDWHEDLIADVEVMREDAARRWDQVRTAQAAVAIGAGERG